VWVERWREKRCKQGRLELVVRSAGRKVFELRRVYEQGRNCEKVYIET